MKEHELERGEKKKGVKEVVRFRNRKEKVKMFNSVSKSKKEKHRQRLQNRTNQNAEE